MQSLTKKSSSTFTFISKMSNIISEPAKIPQKKSMTFKKAIQKNQPSVQIGRQNLFHPKTPTINLKKCNFRRNESKKFKTCFTTSVQTNDKSQISLKNSSFSKKSSYHNFLTKDLNEKSQNQFLLSLIDGEPTDCNKSSKQLMEVKKYYLSLNSSILKNSKINTFVEGPFQALERQFQKRKQQERKKSSSSLEKLSKKMIEELKHRQKVDEQNLISRSRFRSYVHSRSQKPSFTHTFLNRRSIEKSHQSIMKRSLSTNDEKQHQGKKICRESYEKIRTLISQCKSAENEERIKKQMGMFTYYSKQFSKKCEKKFKRFQRINKIQQQETNGQLSKRKFMFDPSI